MWVRVNVRFDSFSNALAVPALALYFSMRWIPFVRNVEVTEVVVVESVSG
jgi:hypothetical protein